MKKVYKEDRDHERAKQDILEKERGRQPILIKQNDVDKWSDDLYEQVVPVDLSSTLTALTF